MPLGEGCVCLFGHNQQRKFGIGLGNRNPMRARATSVALQDWRHAMPYQRPDVCRVRAASVKSGRRGPAEIRPVRGFFPAA